MQVLRPYEWARVPNVSLSVHTLKLSELRGWSLLCEDPVPMLALHIPEENRCIDILELIEHEKLLRYNLPKRPHRKKHRRRLFLLQFPFAHSETLLCGVLPE